MTPNGEKRPEPCTSAAFLASDGSSSGKTRIGFFRLRVYIKLVITLALLLTTVSDAFPKVHKPFQSERDAEILVTNIKNEIKDLLDIVPVYMSLDECLDVAMENNFNIAAHSNIYTGKKYEFKEALSKFLPNAGVEFKGARYNGEFLVGGLLAEEFEEDAIVFNNYLSYDFTKGGRLIFSAKSANNLKKASHHKLEFTKNEILLKTTVNYYRTLESKGRVRIYINNYIDRMEQLKIAEDENASPSTKEFDILRAENEKLKAEQLLLGAARELRYNQAALANVMGIEVSTPVTPIEDKVVIYDLIDESKGAEDIFQVAIENREDLKAIRSEISSMKNQKTLTYLDFAPKSNMRVQYGLQGATGAPIGSSFALVFTVDATIGENLGFATLNKARAQQQEINSRENEIKQILQDIKESIVDSYYTAKISKKISELALEQIEHTTESAHIAEARQIKGEGDFLEIIQAQGVKLDARIQYLNMAVVHNIEQAQLLFDCGLISIPTLLKDYEP